MGYNAQGIKSILSFEEAMRPYIRSGGPWERLSCKLVLDVKQWVTNVNQASDIHQQTIKII